MKRVLTYGTFDLFHIGHLNILRRAKELGDYLIVGVSTDEYCRTKGKIPVYRYEDRKKIVDAIRYVDETFPEQSLTADKIADVKKYHPDVVVWGDDWKGKFDFLRDEGVEVIYLPRTPEISTTKVKDDLSNPNNKYKC